MSAERVDSAERKDYYGNGRQPWDDIVEQGWWVEFSAANVLKYLRRNKGSDQEDAKKARWYYDQLNRPLRDDEVMPVARVMSALGDLLTEDEIRRLREAV